VPQPFVLENKTAQRVAVVGDFNNWNPTATPMSRAEGGLWSAIIPMLPGRHVYGFMVNDSVFTLDPRTPRVRDADFGTDASVVMVGRP
jgi:1,4-alpha-glucan branching enzyme